MRWGVATVLCRPLRQSVLPWCPARDGATGARSAGPFWLDADGAVMFTESLHSSAEAAEAAAAARCRRLERVRVFAVE